MLHEPLSMHTQKMTWVEFVLIAMTNLLLLLLLLLLQLSEVRLFCLCLTPEQPDTCIAGWNVNCRTALNCDELEPRGNWMKFISLLLSLSHSPCSSSASNSWLIRQFTSQLFNFLTFSRYTWVQLHCEPVYLTLMWIENIFTSFYCRCVSLWVLYFTFPLDSSACIQITCFHGKLVSSSSSSSSSPSSSVVRFVHFAAFLLSLPLSQDTLHLCLFPPW